jgi:hypothetical protein
MVVGQRKQQTQQLECNARAVVRRERVAACMLREYCPWDTLSHHEWQVLHSKFAA